MRMVGMTATPYRLGHGMIYGNHCVPGRTNHFTHIAHAITYEELRKAGHLVPLTGKVAHADRLVSDLAQVAVNGDYVLNQLGEVMAREIHTNTAVEAIREYCDGYRRVCVFCCTIDHAEKLNKLINDWLEPCVTIHSQLTPLERMANMDDWKSGKARICTSVNILAEGFDYPMLDCLVFARPTLSARLYLQAIGRVLRTCEGKDAGFLLDLTDNTARFGTDIDRIKADVPKKALQLPPEKREMWKLCPMCLRECHIALRRCECGFEWPPPEIVEAVTRPDVTDVKFEKAEPIFVACTDMECVIHTARKTNNLLGRVKLYYGEMESFISVFLCFEDYYSGFALAAGAKKWVELRGWDENYPASVEEFMAKRHDILKPDWLRIDTSEKYDELVEMIYDDEVPF
jgi:DNA repair protein RadD